ncbi:MAG: HAD-IA family hydrolase [Phycisphaerales bacterium]|nr:HAD-IA family hydrolase [Phycisphaerales bacterium]
MAIRAIIFDFDGLILDTESTELAGWRQIFREEGRELTMDIWANAVGRPNSHFDPCDALDQLLGKESNRGALWDRKRSICREMNLKLQPRDGVVEYLRDAQRLGLKLAIASSSEHHWVTGHLARLNLLDYFACLTTFEDTPTHKPKPGPYLKALEKLGVPAHETIALEDSAHGVAAAKAAGLFCLAVPNEVTRGMDLSLADLIVPSLLELPLETLLRTAGKPAG